MTDPKKDFLAFSRGKDKDDEDKDKEENKTGVIGVKPEAPVVPTETAPKPDAPSKDVFAQEFLQESRVAINKAIDEQPLDKKETSLGEDLDNTLSSINDAWSDVKGFAEYIPQYIEDTDVSDIAMDAVRGANMMAHGVNKGLAGIGDIVMAPISALTIGTSEAIDYVFGTDIAEGTSMTMLSDKFQQYFPDDEVLPEEQEGYFDDLVRITHTGLEFGSGVGLQKGANIITKTADDAALLAKETAFGLSAGAAYQTAKEAGATEGQAFLWSMITPFSPAAVKAGMNPKKLATSVYGAIGTAKDWFMDISPVRALLTPVRTKINDRLYAQKLLLEEDPTLWNEGLWQKAARKFVLNTADADMSIEQRVKSLQAFQSYIKKAIPNTEGMRRHEAMMDKVTDKINAHLEAKGSDKRIALTLEQRYGDELMEMKAGEGAMNITDAFRLVYPDEYNERLTKNHEALYEFLEDNTNALHGDDETAKGFAILFEQYADDIALTQGHIETLAVTKQSVDGVLSERQKLAQAEQVEHAYPQDVVNETLRPAIQKNKELMIEAHQLALDSLPKHIEIDSTPLANSIKQVFENTGVFADPKNMPTYVRTLVNGLKVIKNKSGAGVGSVSRQLLDEGDRLAISKKELIQRKNARRAEWVEAKEALDPDSATYTKDVDALDDQYTKDRAVLDQEGSDLDIKIHENTLAKRGHTKSKEAESLEDIEPPVLTTVGEIAEAITLVNKAARDMYRGQRFEEYRVLKEIRNGLDESMEGLRDQDPAAYQRFLDSNSRYATFISKDINDSMAGKIIRDGDHYPELTGDQVFNQVFENADDDTLVHFLHAFDGDRKDLAPFLQAIDEKRAADGPFKPAMYEFDEYSAEAIGALKDMVYTSLVRKLDAADIGHMQDPVARMRAAEKVAADFVNKHSSKLRMIPGFEHMIDDAKQLLENVGQYRALYEQATTARNMALLRAAAGPNATIHKILTDDEVARGLRDFLENVHVSMDTTGNLMAQKYPQLLNLKGSHGAAAVRKIKKTLMDAYVDEFTNGSSINYEGMLKGLERRGGARQRLVTVLGEKEVVKLESIANLAKALDQSTPNLIESFSQNQLVKAMEDAGLPMGRVASRLQARAVFRPSIGFMAGAVTAKFLDRLAKADTARMLKQIMDDPRKLTDIDNLIGDAINQLEASKKQAVIAEMKDPYGNVSNILHTVTEPIVKVLYRYANHNGYQLTEKEIRETVTTSLTDGDPRGKGETPEVPEETQEPEIAPLPEVEPEEDPTPTKDTEEPRVSAQPKVADVTPPVSIDPSTLTPPSDPTSAIATRKTMKEIRA